ncbi:MAG: bifunctional metallophosphatase/5'-nucleotidase [Erysipelotrichaceae bacterium]|nr:bifunctional metallophosphatase/5'-nucleotidase [Erysipelotrichaceae bacterium]
MSEIRILLSTDVHAYIYPYSYATGENKDHGYAKLAHTIRRFRDENTIVIDNGDNLEGSPFAYFHFEKRRDQKNPFTKAMNMVGYDFFNLGNHDFNHGAGILMDHINGLQMPCISANILYQGKPLSKSYHLIRKADRTIAIFGVVTQYIPNWEKPENIEGFEFQDAFETAKEIVAKIREEENADYIVGIYHGGFEKDPDSGIETEAQTKENEAYRMCTEIEGLDILFTGHQHREMTGILNDTVYLQSAHEARQLSCVLIDTETGKIEPSLINVDDVADQDFLDTFREEEDACQQWLDTPLGSSNVDLSVPDEFDARLHKGQVITFMNKACMDASGADISATALFLFAKGFNRQITMRDLVSTYVFPNTLVLKKVNGKIIREYLERCAQFWDIEDGKIIVEKSCDFPTPQYHNYDMLDGVEYTIKVSDPVGERIIELTRNGIPVKDDDEFTLCINNYRAAGGSGFGMLSSAKTIKDIQINVVEILADYIKKVQVIDFEPVNNIRVVI